MKQNKHRSTRSLAEKNQRGILVGLPENIASKGDSKPHDIQGGLLEVLLAAPMHASDVVVLGVNPDGVFAARDIFPGAGFSQPSSEDDASLGIIGVLEDCLVTRRFSRVILAPGWVSQQKPFLRIMTRLRQEGVHVTLMCFRSDKPLRMAMMANEVIYFDEPPTTSYEKAA